MLLLNRMELKGGDLCIMILTWVLKGGLFCFPLEEKGNMREVPTFMKGMPQIVRFQA